MIELEGESGEKPRSTSLAGFAWIGGMKKSALIVGLIGVAVVAFLIKKENADVQEEGVQDASAGETFAFVTNCVAEFWTIAKKGVEDAGEELGVDVEVVMPADAADQKQRIEDLLSKGVVGMAVSVADPDNQTPFLNQVAEKTILVTADTDAPESARRVYVGMDNYEAGWMCGELVKEALPGGGEVALFIGNVDQDNSRRRRQGVIDCLLGREKDNKRFDEPGSVLKGDKYTVLGTYTDGTKQQVAKSKVEDVLTKNPNIGAMVGLFEYNPPAIIEALKQAGKTGQIKIIGFDENSQTLQGIKDGIVQGTVVQDPYEYGYASIKVMRDILMEDPTAVPEDKFIDIPARTIRKDNVDEFWTELKEKMGDE